jgi:hypothetical protein
VGRLIVEARERITEKMAHIILGALDVCESEGVLYTAKDVFESCKDKHDTEAQVVRMLLATHPEVVRHPDYAHIDSVQEALK